jgi:hypothetical protein
MNPYKAVNKFPDEIIRNTKDFCSLWPFWKKKPNKIKQIKSPYSWWRIKKNHFYIIEVVMEGKLCLT